MNANANVRSVNDNVSVMMSEGKALEWRKKEGRAEGLG